MAVVLKKTHNSRNYQKIWDMFIGLAVCEMFFPTFNCGKFTHTLLFIYLFILGGSSVKIYISDKNEGKLQIGSLD